MKKIIMTALLAGLVISASSSYAIADPLGNTGKVEEEPMVADQESLTVEAPSKELLKRAEEFGQWYGKRYKTEVTKHGRLYTGQGYAREVFLDRMDLRMEFYRDSHRWTKDSHGYKVLQQVRNDVADLFGKEGVKDEKAASDLAYDILNVENKDLQNVSNPDLRSYVDTMILFAMEETMKEK